MAKGVYVMKNDFWTTLRYGLLVSLKRPLILVVDECSSILKELDSHRNLILVK